MLSVLSQIITKVTLLLLPPLMMMVMLVIIIIVIKIMKMVMIIIRVRNNDNDISNIANDTIMITVIIMTGTVAIY